MPLVTDVPKPRFHYNRAYAEATIMFLVIVVLTCLTLAVYHLNNELRTNGYRSVNISSSQPTTGGHP